MLNIPQAHTLLRSTVDDCVDRLLDGAIVLVDTQRLQHLVADEYNHRMQADGKTAWPSAEVYTVNAWLGRIWREFSNNSDADVSQLLSSEQSRQVWERVIAENVRSQYKKGYEYLLWHITATANQVKKAYELMCSFDIDPAEITEPVSKDTENFLIWLNAYKKVLTARGCIDQESLPYHVINAAEEIFAERKPSVVFAGIDAWTPQSIRLLESLKQVTDSVEILEHRTLSSKDDLQCFEFDSTDEEIDACARWARAVIDANPEVHRVGIVASNLNEIRPRLSRKLSDYFNPEAVMEDRQTNKLSFHITLGGLLSEVPIVVDAMNLLELIQPTASVEVMAAVIGSDRIKAWDEESAARAKLAVEIYDVGTDRLSIDEAITLANRSKEKCPELVRLLRRAKRMLSEQPKTADYAFWGRFFMQWLELFQSKRKGNRQFGVDEWQAYRSWVSIVQSLAELGYVTSNIRVETASAKLVRWVGEASVQPRAVRAPVQVGEFLTMAGQKFTHLWILGMNERTIPGSPRPNPFVPISIQKKYSTPNSSATVLNEQIRVRYERILASAEHVVQSYALTDGRELHEKSSFLSHPESINPKECKNIATYENYSSVIGRDFVKCELLKDWQAPPVETRGKISGGTRLLLDQSNCPFRAFAAHRLHLQQMPSVEHGVSRIVRGLLVHRVAEKLYKEYPTQEKLQELSDSCELEEVVVKLTRSVINYYNRELVKPLSNDIVDVEVSIVSNLIQKLVEQDLFKSPFWIFDVENDAKIDLAGITLGLKIDRIDKREDGYVLIDYKTGNCNIADADTPRPKDPQLGIYAIAKFKPDFKVADVAYCQLKNGSVSSDTWAAYHARRPSKTVPIGDNPKLGMLKYWSEELEKLASNFLAGEAVADPLSYACNYCQAAPVCRISSSELQDIFPGEAEI